MQQTFLQITVTMQFCRFFMFSFMLWQGCVYDLVRFSHKKHLVWVHVSAYLVLSGNCLDVSLTVRVVSGLSFVSPLALAVPPSQSSRPANIGISKDLKVM